MAKYLVQSTVIVHTYVELDDTEDLHFEAGEDAADQIANALNAAGLDFDFCDDYCVYDESGNEVAEIDE